MGMRRHLASQWARGWQAAPAETEDKVSGFAGHAGSVVAATIGSMSMTGRGCVPMKLRLQT